MKHPLRRLSAAVAAAAVLASLLACAGTQPSTPAATSGVTVYGTGDAGVGRVRGTGP